MKKCDWWWGLGGGGVEGNFKLNSLGWVFNTVFVHLR